jgi:hypothetical protein
LPTVSLTYIAIFILIINHKKQYHVKKSKNRP